MIELPTTIPGLRVASLLLALYFLVWIPLEGDLRRVVLLAVWAAIVGVLTLVQRAAGGRTVARRRWIILAMVAGLVIGAGASLLTLFLMALKTGLHAHGPEFTPAEIAWVWAQLPLWTVVGLLAGLGLGLLVAAVAGQRH